MTPRYLVVHTAAYDGENDSLEDIIEWHKERGFRTIGYHYYIRKNGLIRKGREDDRMGAHCKASGMNHKSLGICFEGHHDYEDWTTNQKASFTVLCQELMKEYNIPEENVIGHREAYNEDPPPKTCPGKKIDMKVVRNKYTKTPDRVEKYADLERLKAGKIDFNKLEITNTL